MSAGVPAGAPRAAAGEAAGVQPCPRCGYPGASLLSQAELAREAQLITAEYEPLVTVTVAGGLLQADVADPFCPVLTGPSGAGLRAQLDVALPGERSRRGGAAARDERKRAVSEAAAGAGSGAAGRECALMDVGGALRALQRVWGHVYLIGRDKDGYWAARRGRVGTLLRARDPEGLVILMAEDSGTDPS